MWKRLTILCLLTAACSGLRPGPSSTTLEIEALEARVLELQRRSAVDQVEIRRLRDGLERLEAAVFASETSSKVPEPRGIGDEDLPAGTQTGQSSIEVVNLEDDTEEVESGDRRAEPVSAAGQALYDRGYTLYHQGRYLESEETFGRFLRSFGSSDLADNAQYWIGESRLGRGEKHAALEAFRETIRSYPSGNKTPDALFKIGRVLESLGDLEGARGTYLELRQRFPDSASGHSAKAKLEEL